MSPPGIGGGGGSLGNKSNNLALTNKQRADLD